MRKILNLIVLLIIILGFYSYFSFSNIGYNVISENEKVIEVEKGETYYSLPEKFGFNELAFKIYLNLNPINDNLQAGKYKIEAGTTLDDLFKQLKTPINTSDIEITILEGWNIYDIDNYLSNPIESLDNKVFFKKGDFIKSLANFDLNLLAQYNFLNGIDSLEGYLYPDTYFINPNNFSSDILINKMLGNFKTKVYDELLKDKSTQEINKLINLASIVEKEEKNNEEKSTVAGILKKRLDEGWMIGADITVCYPHELTSEECKMVVSKYIKEKSDYNTRTMVGLPKTPIGNPSVETIKATLNYKKTPYYYYLHNTSNGKIYYATTNSEHESNKSLYMR